MTTIWDEIFGTAPPKRQIEEKTEDYQKRAREEHAEQQKRSTARKIEVKALADAEEPERHKKHVAVDRLAHQKWRFSCKVSGGFIVLRWRDEREEHAHALNMSSVSDIRMTAGRPVRKADVVRFNDHSWEFVPEGLQWSDHGWGRPYWTDYFFEERWSSASVRASITFVGPEFTIERIPHRKADEAYLAIMAAIEAPA
jgi:hypothetical protein